MKTSFTGLGAKFWLAIQRQPILIILIYAVLATGLLLPLVPFDATRGSDTPDHIVITIQARMAIDEGQFPLLVAPYERSGWLYPLFQFYSQFPFLLSGLIYKYIIPANPYLANSLVLWLALIVAAFFIYRTSLFLTHSGPASLLAGAIYISSPYILVNIHARGAFTEAIAQGILPVVIFYLIRCYATPAWIDVLLSGIAWAILATTHIITFIYSGLFIGLLVLLLGLTKQATRQQLTRISLAYIWGWLLALYFLAPVILAASHVFIGDVVKGNPYLTNWLTPLPALLSPVSVLPDQRLTTPYLHPAVGWPILISWLIVALAYLSDQVRLITSKKNLSSSPAPPIPPSCPAWWRHTEGFVVPLLGVFCLALFMVWSPIDFWQFLPSSFWVTQFTYRLLSQVMWTGALLSGYAVVFLLNTRIDRRFLLLAVLLLGIASSSWIPPHQTATLKVAELINEPSIRIGGRDYLSIYKPANLYGNLELFLSENHQLKLNTDLNIPKWAPQEKPVLFLDGSIAAEQVTDNLTLSLLINDKSFAQTKLSPGKFSWHLPLKDFPTTPPTVKLKFITTPAEITGKPIKITVNRLTFQGLDSANNAVPVSVTENACKHLRTWRICTVSVPADVQVVQLPVLYYPDLLEVWTNGKKLSYFDTPYRDFALVGVRLPPGHHQISVSFTGLIWAKWLSGITGIVSLAAIGGYTIFKSRNQENLSV